MERKGCDLRSEEQKARVKKYNDSRRKVVRITQETVLNRKVLNLLLKVGISEREMKVFIGGQISMINQLIHVILNQISTKLYPIPAKCS
ncbi:uncharacterized protein LOC124328378 isoform X2 [Daphnia pulicaria]|uniref:uncharacterized protein LOC124328378 isoform X2 n=1 Tax=Daphnia pulicaria TaxID=35523 RepID=UPI001EEC5CB6|nr:uncharacterized protein LOC124328378 isoform X2 [Daphnia pulicaria]